MSMPDAHPTAADSTQQAVSGAAAAPETLVSRFDVWQRHLLDLSLRNNMLNARVERSQIELVLPDIVAFEDSLADNKTFELQALRDDLSLPQDTDAAQKILHEEAARMLRKQALLCLSGGRLPVPRRVQKLYRDARRDLEEMGCNTLFVAVGFLRWKRPAEKDVSHLAPLLLIPVSLSRSAQGYRLRSAEGESRINLTLLELLRQEFDLTLPELEGELPHDEHGLDMARILDIVRTATAERAEWQVEERCSLGIFSFAKYLMWRDMMERRDALLQNAVVGHIAEKSRGAFPGPQGFPTVEEMEKNLHPADLCAPLSYDSSQLSAVMAAAAGKSFVLIGPPGTGKSQTIANMVAQCLAAGKSVLFVAEKSAALNVVYNRLRKVGLGDFCLELHSNKASRGEVLRQFAAVRDMVNQFDAAEWQTKASAMAENLRILQALPATLHAQREDGETLCSYIATVLAAPDVPHIPAVKRQAVTQDDADKLDQIAGNLAAVAAPVASLFATPCMHLAMPSSATEADYSALESSLREWAQQSAALVAARAEVLASLGLLLPQSSEVLAPCTENLPSLAACLGRCRAAAPVAYEDIAPLVESYIAARKKLSVEYPEDAETAPNLPALYEQLKDASLSWALPRWWKTRKVEKALRLLAFTRNKIDCGGDLAALLAMKKARETWESVLVARAVASLPVAGYAATLQQWQAMRVRLLQLRCVEQAGQLPPTPDAVADFVNSLLENRKLWRDVALWRDAATEARRAGMDELPAWLEQRICTPEQLQETALVNYAWRRASEIIAADSSLSGFSAAFYEHKMEDYDATDGAMLKLAGENVRSVLYERARRMSKPEYREELNVLQRELSKQRGHMPLRRLLDAMPRLLPLLKPCMLMSPLSASQYLGAGREPFDVVIFDEASQIPVWDAIGAIARGRSAVIVGDPRQMPPTSFFARQKAEDEPDDDSPVEQDMESILDECIACGVPQLKLRWHYRSRSENLIAFSNKRYYEGQLVTFPSPATQDAALQYHAVEGVYEKGSSRTNPKEARAVVNHVIATLKAPGFEYNEMTSIGIVTFNIQQQELIADMLDEARAADPSLEPFFDENLSEAVFVKNLESVQGDERGVIYFSTTFGPDATGVVSMNFGPLNQQGGERRLNVAITRSRAGMHVFSSLRPEMIDLSRTSARGVADLRGFLEWSMRGSAASSAASSSCSKFGDVVAAALSCRGWTCHKGVGVSDQRIELAVVHPHHPETYLAAIATDSLSPAISTRDRLKLRESVLSGLGWELIRTWVLDWWHRAEDSADKLDAYLRVIMERGPRPRTQYPNLIQTRPPEAPDEMRNEPVAESAHAELPRPAVYRAYGRTVKDPANLPESSLYKHVMELVRIEGPITLNRLCVALCTKPTPTLCGRVSQAISPMLEALVQEGSLERDWQADGLGEQAVYRLPEQPDVRIRERGDREWDEIPPAEIRAAAELVRRANSCFAGSDAHLKATANYLGASRLTPRLAELLSRIISPPG